MYDLAALDQASGVEALPRAGWESAVVWRLTRPTDLPHALEEILMVRFGMGGRNVLPGQEASLGELVAPGVGAQAQGRGLRVATSLGPLRWGSAAAETSRAYLRETRRGAPGAGAAQAPDVSMVQPKC